MRHRFIRSLGSFCLTGLLAGGLALTAHAQDTAEPNGVDLEVDGAPPRPMQFDAEPLDDDAEILRIGGRDYSVQELVLLAGLRPMEDFQLVPERHIPRARGAELERIGRHLAAYDLMAEKARERGMEPTEEQIEQAENYSRQLASSLLYREAILPSLVEPTDEQLRELYEEEKDPRFHRQEEIRMRHIYVSTYETYTVEAGDTLESIAAEISGDEDMADLIVSDETKRPRAEGLGEDEDALPPRALVEGEVLLVPVSGEREGPAREKINAAHERLVAGEDFRTVARDVSENENPGQLWVIRPAEQERPVMPELMETFYSLEDRTFSEPIRTRHGFQIIYRERYQPEGFLPFEEARSTLQSTFSRNQREQVLRDFFAGLAMDERLLEIHEDALAATGEDAAPGDVLAVAGGEEITRAEATSFAAELFSGDDAPTVEEFRDALVQNAQIQNQMILSYLDLEEFTERPLVRMVRDATVNTFLANQYLTTTAEEQASDPTEEALRDRYEATKSSYLQPESYELFGIRMAGDPSLDAEEAAEAAGEQLAELVRGIDNLEDFRNLAAEMNDPGDRQYREGGSMGTRRASTLREPDLSAIRGTTAPGITEVVHSDGAARVFWVQDAIEEYQRGFDEVRDRVRSGFVTELRGRARASIMDEYVSQAEVEVLAPAES